MTVRLSPSARADLEEVWQRIRRDNSGAADRWLDRMLSRVERIGIFPDAVPRLRSSRSARFVVQGHYRILYERQGDGVVVTRVLHGARDLGRLQ